MKRQVSLRINRFVPSEITLILLLLLYQLPIAVVFNHSLRRVGVFVTIAGILVTVLLSGSFKMMILAIVSGVISLCLYYTCWSIFPEYANRGDLISKTLQYYFFWGYLFIAIIFIDANLKQKKKVFVVWLVVTVITMTTTVIGEIRFPGVSRLLAGVATEAESDFYKQYNIGSYNTVYGALVALPIWCYLRKSRKGFARLFAGVMIVYSLLFFVITQYAFAVIGAVAIVAWFIFLSDEWSVKRVIKLILAVSMLFMVVISFRWILDNLLLYTHDHKMDSFYRRLVSIKQLVYTGQQSGDIEKRSEHYLTSIKSFARHPVLGGMVDLKSLQLGRHSELFDYLAALGMWGICFLWGMLKYYWNKCIRIDKQKHIYKYKVVVFVTFLYVFAINLVFNFHNVSFALFILPVLFSTKQEQQITSMSVNGEQENGYFFNRSKDKALSCEKGMEKAEST